MKNATTLTEFQYSRIYAQGWNAARVDSTTSKAAAGNPYPSGPEHTRWQEGFAAASQ
jgi:hypothetical protein